MTSDCILLMRESLVLDRKEEMLAGGQAAIAFGSLGCQNWDCHLVMSRDSQ